MNGMIALPPEPASPAGAAVAGDGFWPAIDLNDLRDAHRIGTIVTNDRLKSAVTTAMFALSIDLAIWRVRQEEQEFLTLATVPAVQMGGVSRLVHNWQHAVAMHVMADLAETHRDIGATDAGAARSGEMALTSVDYRRACTHAVRDILGETRTSVELI